MDRKGILAHDIQQVIARHGIFDIGEVLDATSPSLQNRGNLCSLVEGFREEECIVVTYNNDYSIVDTYRLSYLDMTARELGEVLDICLLYQSQELDSD